MYGDNTDYSSGFRSNGDLHAEIRALQDRINKADARVAELEDALVWALGKLSIEVPVTGGNVSYIRAFEKADKALSSNGRAYLLRKQAEKLEEVARLVKEGSEAGLSTVASIYEGLLLNVTSLRDEADEAERAGGEK